MENPSAKKLSFVPTEVLLYIRCGLDEDGEGVEVSAKYRLWRDLTPEQVAMLDAVASWEWKKQKTDPEACAFFGGHDWVTLPTDDGKCICVPNLPEGLTMKRLVIIRFGAFDSY